MLLQIAFLAASAVSNSELPPAQYGDAFADHYSSIQSEAPSIPKDLPLEQEVVIYSPSREGIARFVRTDGAKVPYEENIGIVRIEHKFGPTIFLVSKGFRTINITWIGERFVFLDKNLGHVANVEEIYDLVNGKWLVQQSVRYRWP